MSDWIHDGQISCFGGVSSATDPDQIDESQIAWGKNLSLRSGKPQTRPAFIERLVLPRGIMQGAGYFSIQSGMLILSIAGRIWRVRANGDIFSYDEITPATRNSSILPQAWMVETNRNFVIQDGQSDAIIYDGAAARRASKAAKEVPRGRQMAYANGRLWVAIAGNQLVAGDIETSTFQDELKFTETTYLLGGGAFYFPRTVTGLAFLPRNDTATGYGNLMVFGDDFTKSVQSTVPRDLWQQTEGMVTDVLTDVGAVSHRAIVAVNQDLYFRSGDGQLRSLRASRVDQQSPGNAPISEEISRIVEFESPDLLATSSGIFFENRLLMTASPFINFYNATSFKHLISLDLAPLATMRGKTPPAYDGQWDGLSFQQLVKGKFRGRTRAFAITTSESGENRLWEIMSSERADASVFSSALIASPIKSSVEYRRFNFELKGRRKRIERCDLYISKIDGPVSLSLYWRADGAQAWHKWDELSVCAQTTDADTSEPHVWKNLTAQHRPQLRSFTIPDWVNTITGFAWHIGFDFQLKLEWTGKLQVDRIVTHASQVDETDHANREDVSSECVYEDVTSTQTEYSIPQAS